MKTSSSIDQQEERKNARDNGASSPTSTPPVRVKMKKLDATRIAKWKWQKGFAPNPTGKNGRNDFAAEIARAAFENNAEALYKAFSKALLKGNAYAFKELSDRAYGRLREQIQVEAGPLRTMSDEDLQKRSEELQRLIGLSSALERVAELERQLEQARALPPASEEHSKPN